MVVQGFYPSGLGFGLRGCDFAVYDGEADSDTAGEVAAAVFGWGEREIKDEAAFGTGNAGQIGHAGIEAAYGDPRAA